MNRPRISNKSSWLIALVLLSLFEPYSYVSAQMIQQNSAKEKVSFPKAEQNSSLMTPYDPQLIELAEILGSLSYLDTLCNLKNQKEGSRWRNMMQALIQEENFDIKRTGRFFEAFNHAYRSYNESYDECTEMAQHAQNFYINKGLALTKELLRRYGTGS